MGDVSNNLTRGVTEGSFSLYALLYLECIPDFKNSLKNKSIKGEVI